MNKPHKLRVSPYKFDKGNGPLSEKLLKDKWLVEKFLYWYKPVAAKRILSKLTPSAQGRF